MPQMSAPDACPRCLHLKLKWALKDDMFRIFWVVLVLFFTLNLSITVVYRGLWTSGNCLPSRISSRRFIFLFNFCLTGCWKIQTERTRLCCWRRRHNPFQIQCRCRTDGWRSCSEEEINDSSWFQCSYLIIISPCRLGMLRKKSL